MRHRVVLVNSLLDEIESAFNWINQDSPINALHWLNGLTDIIQSLADFPDRCAIAPEATDTGANIRHLIYGKYRILFLIDEQIVTVLHLRHSAQDYITADELERLAYNR